MYVYDFTSQRLPILGMIWMGLFMAPGLPAINLVKLALIMYMRSWAVMTSNVPHETVFRASRSNNFYFVLLLMMLFVCILPVAFATVKLKPSWHCGPFSDQDKMYEVFSHMVLRILPERLHDHLDYITSPGSTYTVRKMHDFSITQILREKKFLDCRSAKSADLTHFKALNFDFY